MTRLFTIHEVDEETPVQYVGVYTMNWRPEWGQPTAMFAPVDDPVYDAAHKLLEACITILQKASALADDYHTWIYNTDDGQELMRLVREIGQIADTAITKAAGECNECGGTGTVIVTSSPGLPEHGSIEQESCSECNGGTAMKLEWLKTLAKEARAAIASLPDDALGIAGSDRYQWPIKAELLSYIDDVLAKTEPAQ